MRCRELLALGAAPGAIANPSLTFGVVFPTASPALSFTAADARIDAATGIPVLVFDFIDGQFNSIFFSSEPFDFDGQDNLDELSVGIELDSGPLPLFRLGIDDEITEATLLQGPVETLEISPD